MGTKEVAVLPDSGADISAAGEDTLATLGYHPLNLLPSTVVPKAVNGQSMQPIGYVPVKLKLDGKQYQDELHFFPGVRGAIISWKAARELGILPTHYPKPTQVGCSESVAVQKTQATEEGGLPTPENLMAEYPSVFDGQVRVMEGEMFTITLRDDAVPFCVKAPRTVPFAYRDKLKKELELLQQQGIITPVTQATLWCAPIVVTPKKGTDRIRMCVDLSKLNKFVVRERYQSPTPAEAVADIAAEDAQYFTIIDAAKGYHQCPLAEESQELTTFITPFGRFKFLRAPYGLSSIAEHYNRRMAEALEGLHGYRRIVDDIVIYDKDPVQHVVHVREFLQRCKEKQISINREKWKFCQQEITFAGFRLSPGGYQLDPCITRAITHFPTPTNRSELRSFIGLVNQLSSGTNTITTLLAPLRPLLSTKNEFLWTAEHDAAIANAKQCLTTAPMLAFFDVNKPTRLCTDASRQGLGFIMQQQGQNEVWHLVQAGSRCLTEAESRYAVIELEMLAVSWAIWKCNMFLAGLPYFEILTDHNPLIPILNSHRLDEIQNPRLQRMCMKVMSFNFKAIWRKGATNQAPDALSRSPVNVPTQHELLAEGTDELTSAEIRTLHQGGLESSRMQELRKCANTDKAYQQLKHYVTSGFPDHRHMMPDECKAYWQIRQHLSVEEDLVLYGCRLVIPYPLRARMLSCLHDAHQGSTRTKQRAHLTVYWPGMDRDIDRAILACKQCQDHLPSQTKEPIILKSKPLRPFQEIAADFCYHAGRYYLVVVDCYSDWPTIAPMGKDITTTHMIAGLTELFSRTAVPDVLWSDQGPQFTSKQFQSFAQQWGFRHQTSTPHYPQSNGKAEAAVKSMKKIIRAAWEGRSLNEEKLCRALLQYRNTPSRKDGLSPAQKLYGHPIQDTIPAHRKSFELEWQQSKMEASAKSTAHMESSRRYYNAAAHSLPEIVVGTNVAVQNPQTKLWDTYGMVTAIGPQRQYHVKTSRGTVLIRNRRFIRRRVPESVPYLREPEETRAVEEAQGPPPRQSHRLRKPVQRLVEDPTWP